MGVASETRLTAKLASLCIHAGVTCAHLCFPRRPPSSQLALQRRQTRTAADSRLHGSSLDSTWIRDDLYQQLTRYASATFTYEMVSLGQSAFRCVSYRFPVCFSEGCVSLSCAAVYLERTDLTVRSSVGKCDGLGVTLYYKRTCTAVCNLLVFSCSCVYVIPCSMKSSHHAPLEMPFHMCPFWPM